MDRARGLTKTQNLSRGGVFAHGVKRRVERRVEIHADAFALASAEMTAKYTRPALGNDYFGGIKPYQRLLPLARDGGGSARAYPAVFQGPQGAGRRDFLAPL
jgi:hypothetical protein